MARAFSKREREIIRQKLIEKGRQAFSTFGLKKTSMDDLAQAVGISKGSFYAFFDSKEDMYLDIIEAEESRFREQVMARVSSDQSVTKQSLKTFILESMRLMEMNPLLRRMHEQDELNQFLQTVSPDRVSKHFQKDEDWLRNLVASWQEQGIIVDGNPQVIAGALVIIITSSLYKDSLGGKNYPEAINLLVDLVASGLTTKNQGT